MGFIGGRLAEVSCGLGVPTVALVRQWSRAARLSRLPVEMAHADILDLDALRRAAQGCDTLFHCAVDFRRIAVCRINSSIISRLQGHEVSRNHDVGGSNIAVPIGIP